MRKIVLILLSLCWMATSYATDIRVVTECSGVELGDDGKICCFYLDHMIYINNNYAGVFKSRTGTCCPEGQGFRDLSGELTTEQVVQIMQSEEFQNSANEAMHICSLGQAGKFNPAEIYPNPASSGSFTVKFSATYEGPFILTVVNLNGQEMYRSTVMATVGNNEILIDYSSWSSALPNHYLVRIIGEIEGFSKTIRVY